MTKRCECKTNETKQNNGVVVCSACGTPYIDDDALWNAYKSDYGIMRDYLNGKTITQSRIDEVNKFAHDERRIIDGD